MSGRFRSNLKNALKAPLVARARLRDRLCSDSARHQLAICAIFRDEAPFLKEWIEFHRGVGATHFYLYDNFSADGFREVLAPFIAEGLVTLTNWPVRVGQKAAYAHCLRAHWKEARWIALIDIDEFLFAPDRIDIRPILDRFSAFPGIHIWQAFFGSSGLATTPPVPTVEAFTMRAPLSITTAKSIVNPRAVYRVDIHVSKYWWSESVDTARRVLEPDRKPVLDVLRINHYWSRSLQDLEEKIRRGDASTSTPRDRDWHFAREQALNAERDESIVPISRAIRSGRNAL